jgi:SAM-dependent methyltransferase
MHRLADTDAKSGEPLDIFLCNECGLIQQAPLPDEQSLEHYYSSIYRIDYKGTRQPKPKHVLRSTNQAVRRLEFLRRNGLNSGTLLDIGAGSGEFVAMARKQGYGAAGIEPDPGYSGYARNEYSANVATAQICDASGRHEIITLFHVLEHLRSPVEAFASLHSLLAPGGRLFIEVPWILSGAISPSNRYFKAHLFYFDVRTLAACASSHFDEVVVETNGNLMMLLRARETPAPLKLPPPGYAGEARRNIEGQGWLRYITHGKGWRKPFFKLRSIMAEQRVSGLSGSQILESFQE